MTAYLLLVLGLVVLLFAGDLLVRGAVAIAVGLGIPPLIIGLTIVAFGTSAPELVISLDAALSNAPGIALGNVVGSNIANILLVLGLPSIVYATHCDQPGLLRNTVFMLFATVVFIALAFTTPLHLWQGAILLTLLIAFLWDSGVRARRAANGARSAPAPTGDGDGAATAEVAAAVAAAPSGKRLVSAAMVIAGLIGLPLGSHFAVTGAREIALAWGMSNAAVGLTVVAIGTSLPELAATMMAALRRESAIAVGNVIGSNIFNLLSIMGLTALAAAVPVAPVILQVDLWVMLASSLAVLPFVYWRLRIGRLAGMAFLAVYVAYVVMVVAHRSAGLAAS
ncbi:calcium/sodium antiporter [Microbaculum marinisediminis]|uniref:Calcium/sodium antiporter n=1 Tax=Microbaculum marinisediminis TaxID=2931392 RepID=A0AAW5QVP4_9HYPH|nr:calcium/sodium antiporter [Microbaculum sp. A6E488]MCT8971972.1 calcium/sodium antiporter [Microbaculum sp. A6E488]